MRFQINKYSNIQTLSFYLTLPHKRNYASCARITHHEANSHSSTRKLSLYKQNLYLIDSCFSSPYHLVLPPHTDTCGFCAAARTLSYRILRQAVKNYTEITTELITNDSAIEVFKLSLVEKNRKSFVLLCTVYLSR